MARPMTADPMAWAEYNARCSSMTPSEFAAEQESVRKQCAGDSVLDETVAVLTPSGELVAQVRRIHDRLRGLLENADFDDHNSYVFYRADTQELDSICSDLGRVLQ